MQHKNREQESRQAGLPAAPSPMGKLLSRGLRRARVATGYEVVPDKVFIVDDRITGQDQAAQNLFMKLRIDQTVVNCLYSKFLEIDKDGSHEIDIDEYYRHFKMERTPWADKVFMIMDEDETDDEAQQSPGKHTHTHTHTYSLHTSSLR